MAASSSFACIGVEKLVAMRRSCRGEAARSPIAPTRRSAPGRDR